MGGAVGKKRQRERLAAGCLVANAGKRKRCFMAVAATGQQTLRRSVKAAIPGHAHAHMLQLLAPFNDS